MSNPQDAYSKILNVNNSQNAPIISTNKAQYPTWTVSQNKDAYVNNGNNQPINIIDNKANIPVGNTCHDTYLNADETKCNNILAVLINDDAKLNEIIATLNNNEFVWDENKVRQISNIPPFIAKNILRIFKFQMHAKSRKIQDVKSWMQEVKQNDISDDLKAYLQILVDVANKFDSEQNKPKYTQPIKPQVNTQDILTSKNIGYAYPSQYAPESKTESGDLTWRELSQDRLNMLNLRNRPFRNMVPTSVRLISNGQYGGNDGSSTTLEATISNIPTALSCSTGVSKILLRLINKMKSVGFKLDDVDEKALNDKIKSLEDVEKNLNIIANNISKYTKVIELSGRQGDFNEPTNADNGLVGNAEQFKQSINDEISNYQNTLKLYDNKSTKLTSIIPLLIGMLKNVEEKQEDKLVSF